MSAVSARALSATVVAVVPEEACDAAARTLVELARTAGVRPIVVSLGDLAEAPQVNRDGVTVISGLVPQYLNNAVASMRLSSLPSIGWWRAHHSAPLRDLAVLVDRLLLDVEEPAQTWSQVPALTALTAVSDMRWARLTRWRELLAQFLDIPAIRRLDRPFDRLDITGSDRHASALLAGWLKARLPGGAELAVVLELQASAPLARVELAGPAGRASLQLLSNGKCLKAEVRMEASASGDARVAALGEQDDISLLAGELRIRSRDPAFEEAVREAMTL